MASHPGRSDHPPSGGSIDEDPIDPSSELASHVGQAVGGAVVPVSTRGSGFEFTVASFNVLGHSHTVRGGNKPGYDSSSKRMRWTVRLLRRHRIDVVGLQEFQRPQKKVFKRLTRSSWSMWHPHRDPVNAIAWRSKKWHLVEARTLTVPYFYGRPKKMPVIRLRSRPSGRDVWFINVHNPADTRGPAGHLRRIGMDREVDLAHRLARTGVPVVLTGDMNERTGAHGAFTRDGTLRAATSASLGPGGSTPPDTGVDWIFATGTIDFASWMLDRAPQVARASDHPLAVARAMARAQ